MNTPPTALGQRLAVLPELDPPHEAWLRLQSRLDAVESQPVAANDGHWQRWAAAVVLVVLTITAFWRPQRPATFAALTPSQSMQATGATVAATPDPLLWVEVQLSVGADPSDTTLQQSREALLQSESSPYLEL